MELKKLIRFEREFDHRITNLTYKIHLTVQLEAMFAALIYIYACTVIKDRAYKVYRAYKVHSFEYILFMLMLYIYYVIQSCVS